MVQAFSPPKTNEIVEILQTFSLIGSLQKLSFLPPLHAFSGRNEDERKANAIKIVQLCAEIFRAKKRSDIDFVDF